MHELIFMIIVIGNNLFSTLSEGSYHCFLPEFSEMPSPLGTLKLDLIIDLLINAYILP